jgi:hypothetical protein
MSSYLCENYRYNDTHNINLSLDGQKEIIQNIKEVAQKIYY